MVEDAIWFDEIFRVQDPSAIVALVSPRRCEMAIGTLPLDEPVRKKSFVRFTIWKDDVLSVDVAILFQSEIEFFDILLVDWALGSCVVVESYVEPSKALDEYPVILVGELTGFDVALQCFYFYWSAVFITTAYHDDILPFQPEVARVDVG